MKTKLSVLLLSLVVCLCAFTTLSQGEEQKAQLYLAEDYAVKPGKVIEFEAILKEIIAVYEKYDWPYPMRTYSSNYFHYYFFYPIENYADMDKAFEVFYGIVDKWGENNWQEWMKRSGDVSEYYKQFFVRTVPEVQYIPDKPRLKPEEHNCFIWDILYLYPGRDADMIKAGKQGLELLKSKNYDDETYWYAGDIGTDMPVYIGVLFGKDFADIYVQNKKMWELMGEEGGKLFDKMLPLIRKRESIEGWCRPDLSYMPKEK